MFKTSYQTAETQCSSIHKPKNGQMSEHFTSYTYTAQIDNTLGRCLNHDRNNAFMASTFTNNASCIVLLGSYLVNPRFRCPNSSHQISFRLLSQIPWRFFWCVQNKKKVVAISLKPLPATSFFTNWEHFAFRIL